MEDSQIRFIDLFAGIGGFRLAFERFNRCKCVFSSEFNESCQRVYFDNYGEYPSGDITKITSDEIPDFDILCAGFPCQPFSICGKKLGFEDTRGTLFFDVCRIIKDKKPKVVVLENVKHLTKHDHGNTFKVIISTLEELGYCVEAKVLSASDFGVAQSRERIIIIGMKGLHFDFSDLKKKPKVFLKDILDKEGNFEYLNASEYTILDDSMLRHQESGLLFRGYRNKGTWRNGVRPHTEHLSRVHRQPNRIYSTNGLHPTLPSQETAGRFWIYNEEEHTVRKLTINECYRLMGFPSDFKICNCLGDAYKQAGNSVAVPMIAEIAASIIRQYFNGEQHHENIRRNNQQLSFNF